jgi:hypothetical protein
MKSTPFDPLKNLAPTPFDERHCEAAARLKVAGLPWMVHTGCFVWDHKGCIEVGSPFPCRIYFILNLGHFLKRFGTTDAMAEHLVWLPTWHQTRLLCDQFDVSPPEALNLGTLSPGDELIELYERLLTHLRRRGATNRQ